MRIGIDVRYLSHGLVGGVHAYVKSVVPEIIRQANESQIFLYADSKRPFELNNLPDHVTLRMLPYRNGLSSFLIDFTLQKAMQSDQIDIAHFPANYGFGPRNAQTLITLHDEINIMPLREIIQGHRKDPRTIAMMTYLHFCSTAAIRRAKLILTVSAYAAKRISHYSGIDLQRVIPIHHGRSTDLHRITDHSIIQEILQRHQIQRPYILGDALKNPGVTIRAWRRLPEELRSRYQIVFFSRRPDPLPVVGEAVAEGIAQLLIRPSREDLIGLLSSAEAFVFPSWIEGFGIPLLEAMTCGAPVIASDRGSIPEVLGGAGLIADAEDDTAIAAYILELLTKPEVASTLQQRGLQRATEFSWAKTAAKTIACYQQSIASMNVLQAT